MAHTWNVDGCGLARCVRDRRREGMLAFRSETDDRWNTLLSDRALTRDSFAGTGITRERSRGPKFTTNGGLRPPCEIPIARVSWGQALVLATMNTTEQGRRVAKLVLRAPRRGGAERAGDREISDLFSDRPEYD